MRPPADTGADVGDASTVSGSPQPRRVFRVALAIGIVVVGAVGLWLMSSDAVRDGPGQPSVAGSLTMDESVYLGLLGVAQRTVVATSFRAHMTEGLEAAVLVCHRDRSYDGSVYSGDRAAIDGACARLVPATGDTLLEAGFADTYLVVEVTRTGDGPQRFCGLDITYRDGFRRGQASRAGEEILLDAGNDAWDDPAKWPPCP